MTRTVRIKPRDLKILKAMIANIEAFITECDKAAGKDLNWNDSWGVPAIHPEITVTLNIEET